MQAHRFAVLQLDFSEEHPNGTEYVITTTDDATHANREARFYSVPGNPAWVRDTRPDIKRACR